MKLQRLLPIIGITIFLYILWNMDLGKVWGFIQSIDPVMLLLAVSISVPIVLLKAYKWKLLVKSCGIDYSFKSSVSAWLVGFSIGIITPGRLGDLSRAYYLRDRASLGKGLTTVVIDRLIDVIVLFVLTIVGLSFLITAYYIVGSMLIPISILFIALIAVSLLFTRRGVVASLVRPLFRRLVPDRYKPKLGSLFKEFYKGLGIMRRKKSLVLLSVVICLAAWAFSILQYYVISLSLGFEISYSFFFMIAPLTILLDALPISFSGLGTRDAVMIYFLALIGLSAESAVALSIMIFLVCYILMGIVGMFFWIKNPIRKANNRPTSSTSAGTSDLKHSSSEQE